MSSSERTRKGCADVGKNQDARRHNVDSRQSSRRQVTKVNNKCGDILTLSLVSKCFSPGVGAGDVGAGDGGEVGDGVSADAEEGHGYCREQNTPGTIRGRNQSGAQVRFEFKPWAFSGPV